MSAECKPPQHHHDARPWEGREGTGAARVQLGKGKPEKKKIEREESSDFGLHFFKREEEVLCKSSAMFEQGETSTKPMLLK